MTMPRKPHQSDRLYHWIVAYIQRTGESPTYDQMAEAMGWTSKSTPHQICARLIDEGKLSKGARREVRLPRRN